LRGTRRKSIKDIVGKKRIVSGIGMPFHGAFICDAVLNPGSLRVLKGYSTLCEGIRVLRGSMI
jgi:hypothetical protein